MRSLIFVCLTVLTVLCRGIYASSNCKENVDLTSMLRLKKELFCNYDTDVRPTPDHRHVTVISISISIEHFTVYEPTNTVNFHTLTKLFWNDSLLTWEPSNFGGINMIHVMSDEIWVPDITLHSAIIDVGRRTDADIDVIMPKTSCMVYVGQVLCVPPVVYAVHCDRDTTWWPYDTMSCSLQISSWAYSTEDIRINSRIFTFNNEESTTLDTNNTEWDLTNVSHGKYLVDFKLDTNFTSKMISFNVLLKRRSSAHNINYITVAIVLFSVTLVVLWLQPESNERMILANMNFVLHLLALLQIAWTAPFNGNTVPKIVLLYENSFLLAIFALVLTSVLRHMQGLSVDAPSWVSSVSTFILNSRIGQIFLVTVSDPKASAQMEINAEDNTNLVSITKRQSTWRHTSILIGWLSFIIVLFTYTILLAVSIPTSTSAHPVA